MSAIDKQSSVTDIFYTVYVECMLPLLFYHILYSVEFGGKSMTNWEYNDIPKLTVRRKYYDYILFGFSRFQYFIVIN